MNGEENTATFLAKLFAADITPIDGGVRVKETETAWVDVQRMIYNWRVARTPKDRPEETDRAWCFYGTGHLVLLRAVDAALRWDGADDTAPAGWDKNAVTGEYARSREAVGLCARDAARAGTSPLTAGCACTSWSAPGSPSCTGRTPEELGRSRRNTGSGRKLAAPPSGPPRTRSQLPELMPAERRWLLGSGQPTSWRTEVVQEDIRDVVAGIWDKVAEDRLMHFLDENHPGFMSNSMKDSAERALRNARNIGWWRRRGY